MSLRNPAVAGQFYEGTENGLRAQIEKCFLHSLGPGKLPEINNEGKRNIVGIVSPHAGYTYSGPVAARGFSALASDGVPSTAIIIGLNHHGTGKPLAVSAVDSWKTPLGSAKVDKETVEKLINACRLLEPDESAHRYEHSIEVQVPFLQYIYGDGLSIVPVCMMEQDIESCKALGKALAGVLKGKNAIMIASTDFTHYEGQEAVERKDMSAVSCILKLDPDGLMDTVAKQKITMCGPGPVAAMLIAAKGLGAKEAELLKHATSGDISGDRSEVVGYASIIIRK